MTDFGEPILPDQFWNEAEQNAVFNSGLLTILANNLAGNLQVVGTGFIISAQGSHAYCITAAHVFAEIRNLQSPPQRHNLSALPEFLPPPRAIDVDTKKVRAMSIEGGKPEMLVIDGLCFDEDNDIAFFSVSLQTPASSPYFVREFQLNSSVPHVGELVAVLSYGNQGINDRKIDGQHQQLLFKRRPVLRIGRVLSHYPEGHRLCRGPCIETSIPVYSGMSGGPAIRFGSSGQAMTPFALVCSDPDFDGPDKQDRSFEGHSIFALLPVQTSFNENGQQVSELKCNILEHNTAGRFRAQQHTDETGD